MQFIYPAFLFALPVVLIPLIIHLFRFRRYRKVYFSNIRFIEDLKLETERKSRLKHILVLITRMLALAMLVMAFAQPYIPLRQSDSLLQPVRYVSIYVDNSFSMEAASEEGVLLESAKLKAAGIAAAYEASDLFHLITNDLEGRHHRYISREDFLNHLLDVEPSPISLELEEVIIRHKDLLEGGRMQADLYVLSDFQYSLIPPASSWSDSGLFVFFLPLKPVTIDNVFIDSAWFNTPVQLSGMQSGLSVRVRNAGLNPVEKLPLRFTINGEQRAVAALDIPPGANNETSIMFRPESAGWYHGELEIIDYPIVYDDKYYLAFHVREQIPILSIFEDKPGPFLAALFGKDSAVVFHETRVLDLDYGILSSYDLIILNGVNKISSGLVNVLSDFVDQGGSLVVFPGSAADRTDHNLLLGNLGLGIMRELDTTDTRVSEIDEAHPLMREVFDPASRDREGSRTDYPVVMAHYPIDVPGLGGISVVGSMQNGRPFLLSSSSMRGQAYLFAVPLAPGFSNLPRHAIVVPILYQMALQSRPLQQLSHEIGKDNLISLSGIRPAAEVLKLKSIQGGPEMVPEMRRRAGDVNLLLHGQVREAGVFQVLDTDMPLAMLAFNYNRAESDLRYFSPEELESMSRLKGWTATRVLDPGRQDTLQMVQDINKGTRFWKWFVVMAILMLAVESILLRFMK